MLPTSTGRPRDPAIDTAVLAATRELLIEVGYHNLSFAKIAERAGSSRPALYRRWPSKAHLVHDAVFHRGPLDLPPDGSFADDLRAVLRNTFASYTRPEVQEAVPGLLAELRDPDLRHSVRDGLFLQVRAWFAARVARAVEEGDVSADVDADVLLDTITGAITQRAVTQQSTDATFADQLADLLLRGLSPP